MSIYGLYRIFEVTPERIAQPLFASQFAALEHPESAVEFDISREPAEIVRGIREALAR